MFQRKATILFSIIGIATILGCISGTAPGYYLKSYALFAIAAAFLLFIFILLIIIILDKNQKSETRSIRSDIFHQSLSRKEKILFIFTCSMLFISGIFLGILCELLFKAISVSLAVHLIIAGIFILILFVALIVMLIIEMIDSKTSKTSVNKEYPVIIETNPRSQIVTKPQDGPKNTATRINRYHTRQSDKDSKNIFQESAFNDFTTHSTDTFNIPKSPSTIRKEYQKLLHPSSRYYINDKVYVNDNDNHLAEIIEADGLGNYRIQYLDNGLMDFKNGTELRKALPLLK